MSAASSSVMPRSVSRDRAPSNPLLLFEPVRSTELMIGSASGGIVLASGLGAGAAVGAGPSPGPGSLIGAGAEAVDGAGGAVVGGGSSDCNKALSRSVVGGDCCTAT